jgi:hypothetical protein
MDKWPRRRFACEQSELRTGRDARRWPILDLHNVKQRDPYGSKSGARTAAAAQAQARNSWGREGAGVWNTQQRAHDARVDAKPGFAREFRGFSGPPACRRRALPAAGLIRFAP